MKDPDTGYGLDPDEIKPGTKVMICPGYDLWMMGAQTGVIRKVLPNGNVKVKMDHWQVKVMKTFPIDRLKYIGYNWRQAY